jgi:hypothetical protein
MSDMTQVAGGGELAEGVVEAEEERGWLKVRMGRATYTKRFNLRVASEEPQVLEILVARAMASPEGMASLVAIIDAETAKTL